MLKLNCKLHFKDGKELNARMEANDPQSLSPVTWSGSLERISQEQRYESTQPSVLRTHFKVLAKNLDARYEEQANGVFDTWAK